MKNPFNRILKVNQAANMPTEGKYLEFKEHLEKVRNETARKILWSDRAEDFIYAGEELIEEGKKLKVKQEEIEREEVEKPQEEEVPEEIEEKEELSSSETATDDKGGDFEEEIGDGHENIENKEAEEEIKEMPVKEDRPEDEIKKEVSEEAREIQRQMIERGGLFRAHLEGNDGSWDDPELVIKIMRTLSSCGESEKIKVLMENFDYDKEEFKKNIIEKTKLEFYSGRTWKEIMELAGLTEEEMHEVALGRLPVYVKRHIDRGELRDPKVIERIAEMRDAYGISDDEWKEIAREVYQNNPDSINNQKDDIVNAHLFFKPEGGKLWE